MASPVGDEQQALIDAGLAVLRRRGSDGLTVNDVVVAHTKPDLVGKPWVSDRRNYEYVVDLTPPNHPLRRSMTARATPTRRRPCRRPMSFPRP